MDIFTKLDLHIHSRKSLDNKNGEPPELINNSLERIDVLMEKLSENQINMAAITDHNTFDLELYNALKLKEDDLTVKKILPGIEFDVIFNDVPVHVVSIFDDGDINKITKIDSYLDDSKDRYSLAEFSNVLSKIGLDVLLIAHQKCDYSDSTRQVPTSFSSAGVEMFYQYIGCEYFDALEIQTTKVEGILKSRFYDDVRIKKDIPPLIIGSDCHDWDVYPSHDNKNIKTIDFNYIKSEPSFRGLVMAMTETRRFRKSIPQQKRDTLKELLFQIDGNIRNIPMSDYINVIIGDNSVGKSTLIKILNNTAEPKAIEFLDNHKVTVITNALDSGLYEFSAQGSIREMFERTEEKLPIKDKFKKFFENIDFTNFKHTIDVYFDRLFEIWEQNEAISNSFVKMKKTITIPKFTSLEKHYLSINKDLEQLTNVNESIVKELNALIIQIDKVHNSGIETDEKVYLSSVKESVLEMLDKYEKKKLIIDNNNLIRNSINVAITMYNEKIQGKMTDDEERYKLFVEETTKYSSAFSEHLELNLNPKNISINFTKFKIESKISSHGKYSFVCKVVEDVEVTNTLLEEFVRSYVGLVAKPITDFTSSEAIANIRGKRIRDKISNNLNEFKSNMKEDFEDKYFKTTLEIKKDGDNLIESNSAGINALYYLDILSVLFEKKVFIIDQPEDDVSQSRINESLITSFRNLSLRAQLIIVTHNPQLVVNLDADNVIVLSKSENNDKIDIISGPLENNEILELVANTLDGGKEVVKKRYKRYV